MCSKHIFCNIIINISNMDKQRMNRDCNPSESFARGRSAKSLVQSSPWQPRWHNTKLSPWEDTCRRSCTVRRGRLISSELNAYPPITIISGSKLSIKLKPGTTSVTLQIILRIIRRGRRGFYSAQASIYACR